MSFPQHLRTSALPLIIAALAAILLTWNSLRYLSFRGSSLSHAPIEWSSDDVDYDNLAMTLMHRGVFGFDWDDPEWTARYRAFNQNGYFDSVLNDRHGFGITTFKPPALPFLLSIMYRIFGTGFAVGRVLNISFMALATFFAVFMSGRLWGSRIAFLSALFMLIYPQMRAFAPMLMTESMATFLATLSFFTCLEFVRSSTSKPSRVHSVLPILTGLLLGLLVLTRYVFFLWVPLIFVLLVLWSFLSFKKRKAVSMRKQLAFLLCAYCLVALPWMLRNSIVSGHFAPLGSEGNTSLPGGYSDESFENRGEWIYAPYISTYMEFESMDHSPTSAPAEYEFLRGIHARNVAYTWARQNWRKMPMLMLMRVYSHHVTKLANEVSFGEPMNIFLFCLLIFGLVGWCSRSEGWLFLAVFAIDSTVTALTYPSIGRLITPIIPLYAMTSAGVIFLPAMLSLHSRHCSRLFS